MKVGIITDALNRTYLSGIGVYTYNLILHLQKIINHKNREIILIDYKKHNYFNDIENFIVKNPFGKNPYLWYLYLEIYFQIKNDTSLDIIHNVRQVPTLFKFKQKYVITVHDITPLLFPYQYRKEVYLINKLMLPRTLRMADKIISVSYHTKRDLIKYLKIPKDKIEVIYHGVDEDYKPLPEKEVEMIKKKYNITTPFILYVGSLKPLKNIPTLIKAYYKLRKQGLEYKLVITGKKRWKYREIFKLINKLNLQKDVIFTGYVPREDLPALYNAADLFVSPSLYEGFGLPPLEAMACGTPVITSNTSSLPEVVGDAGIMVDPYDVDGLAKAMYEVLTNDGLREELRKRGLKRAKLFNWKKCAEEHLKVYEEVYHI